MNWGLLIFIAGMLLVIMVHEAGHFFMAKVFDFKATKFFLGFGPTLWSTQRGETEYGIKALPLGGFVKIVGMNPYEDVAAEDEPRSYMNKPRWQRALVLVAGSATHWPVAFIILVVTAVTIGFPTGSATTEIEVVETSLEGEPAPAFDAGLRPGDVIVGVGDADASTWSEIRRYIRRHPGEEATFTVARDGEPLTISVTLGSAAFDESGRLVEYAPPGEELPGGQQPIGFLGVSPKPEFHRESVPEAIVSSAKRTGEITMLSVRGIGDVFGMVFGGELWDALTGDGERDFGEGPLGIVGAGQIASESFARGRFLDLIGLIVGFTVFVGLMNLLPLPPLDGGHLAVVAFESATGRDVDLRKLIPIAAAVISFFVLLFIAVLYLDLARPIKVPF